MSRIRKVVAIEKRKPFKVPKLSAIQMLLGTSVADAIGSLPNERTETLNKAFAVEAGKKAPRMTLVRALRAELNRRDRARGKKEGKK